MAFTAGQKLRASDLDTRRDEYVQAAPGLTVVGTGNSDDNTVVSFTMPYTGKLIVRGHTHTEQTGAGVMLAASHFGPSTPTPTNAPQSIVRANSVDQHYTYPLIAYWSSIVSGTAVTIVIRLTNAGTASISGNEFFGTYTVIKL